MAINVVILAAGQGKRMYSSRPKVLHELAGRPLISYVIETARTLGAGRICVVYGHGGEQVPQAVGAPDLVFARQEPQKGTGHALQQALPHLGAAATTLVLYGDVPLVRPETLSAMLGGGNAVVALTAELDDPAGYGRIVRDKKGRVTKIVEEKDASTAERNIREVNTGIMALPTRHVAGWLDQLKNHNVQGEYYLTDIVALALADGVAVETARTREAWEMLGVNSKTQLALIGKWNKVYNLTAVREPGNMLSQHLLDCLAVVPHVAAARTLVDVGSGAGLPGIPLALALPQLQVTLLEANHKKAAFLRQATIELGLDRVVVVCERAETWQPPARFDVVISRAFSALPEFLAAAGRLCAQEGTIVAMKGVHPDEELTQIAAGYQLRNVVPLAVPGLAAQRHLVLMRPQSLVTP